MNDIVGSAKNFVTSAVSRTSWEAQRQLRLRGKQSELDKLWEQRQNLLNELGQVAMTLYQQGKLTDTQLSRLCASILELDSDAQTRETQLQELKNETYPADQFVPGQTANYTPPPTSAADAPSSAGASASSNAGMGSQTQPCPNCGQPLRPNALYCRSCGAKLR